MLMNLHSYYSNNLPPLFRELKISLGIGCKRTIEYNHMGYLHAGTGYGLRLGAGGIPEFMETTNTGIVGIGLTAPNYPLHMTTDSLVTVAGVWTNASDARRKTNVKNTNHGLQTVMQLRPVNYTMVKGGVAQAGFLDQEVQKILPKVVSGAESDIENGETLGLSYGNSVPVLTKATQEQRAQIEVFKARHANLIQKADTFDQLKAGMKNLKKTVNRNLIQ